MSSKLAFLMIIQFNDNHDLHTIIIIIIIYLISFQIYLHILIRVKFIVQIRKKGKTVLLNFFGLNKFASSACACSSSLWICHLLCFILHRI